ncbi:helix-turn-helix transcriptional regulator [Sphingomonas melonis]|uniref:helix-turn-helix transcriptional regulator n=1 Tax=Sphingomonas melonis TaxID=152682 RepID=UPI0035C867A2
MRRADRLFEIIQLLREARNPVSASLIATDLEVSKRTVYRDMASLIAQRVPIRGEAGVGYVLESGFDMPPLMLTEDEIDAAALGASWVSTRAEPELAAAAMRLLAKIEAVVPDEFAIGLREQSTSVAPVQQSGEIISANEVRLAIRLRKKLKISYGDAKGAQSERVIWPVLLGYRDTGRILAAWCELRQAFRYFRTDQMLSVETLEDAIPESFASLRARWNEAMAIERARYTSAAKAAGNK